MGAYAAYCFLHLLLRWYLIINIGWVQLCCQWQTRDACLLPLIEGMKFPPDLLHILPGGVGRSGGRVPIPPFQYSVRSTGVCSSRGSLQTRPNISCCLLCLSPRLRHKGPSDGSGEPPCHVAAVLRVLPQGHTLINKPDGFGVNQEGARGALQFGGDRFQGFRVPELGVYSTELCGGG